jgi:hypothetical protein
MSRARVRLMFRGFYFAYFWFSPQPAAGEASA